jgi:hypothetical protein
MICQVSLPVSNRRGVGRSLWSSALLKALSQKVKLSDVLIVAMSERPTITGHPSVDVEERIKHLVWYNLLDTETMNNETSDEYLTRLVRESQEAMTNALRQRTRGAPDPIEKVKAALEKSIARETELNRRLSEAKESKGRLGRLLYFSLAREQALTSCLEDILARQDNARQVLDLVKRSAEALLAEETTINTPAKTPPSV